MNPHLAGAAAGLANLEVKRGNYDETLRLVDVSLKADPGLSSAYFAGSQAYLAKGQIKPAQSMLDEGLSRDPNSLPGLAIFVNLSERQGRSQEAAERLSKLVAQSPQNPGLHFLLAVTQFSLKNLDHAEASVRQAIALDPKTPEAYTLLANIDFARGAAEKAKADLRKAIETSPRNLSNYVALGTQFEKEGNWEEAMKLFEKAHQIDPNSPFVADELAFLYLEHGGDVNVALNLAQTAKQELPNSPIAADALGWAYFKIGSAESAVEQLKDCAREVPKNPVFQYHLGMAYVAAGHPDAARNSLQKALADDPNFPYAANARVTLAQISGRSH